MKKYLLCITILLFEINLSAQIISSCLPEGIEFTSQAQIDSFPSTYSGCSIIEGDIMIINYGSNCNISNLHGLSGITTIYGNLEINYCESLSDLNGLEGLDSVGGYVSIYGQSMEDLSGLDNLRVINSHLLLGINSLTSLHGLESLEWVGGDLQIGTHTPTIWTPINDLTALSNLYFLGGGLHLYLLSDLNDLTGLESLTNIGGGIKIWWSNFNSLTGLDNLESIGGSLDLASLSLNDLSGLESLISLGGDLILRGNSLTSLEGIENLDPGSIQNITIAGNNSLSSCDIQSICDYLSSPGGSVNIYDNAPGCNNPAEIAESCGYTLPCLPFGNYYFISQQDVDNFQNLYPGCTELGGDVIIKWNWGDTNDISNLSGLMPITAIDGSLTISLHENLNTLSGLDNLLSIGGDLRIERNDSLINLSGLESLHSLGGELYIYRNQELINLNGLSQLNSIGEDFILRRNDLLSDLSGLNNLESIYGNLEITNNDTLCSLTGLDSLISIGGDIYISGNPALNTLLGMDALNSIGGGLIINHNPLLSKCDISGICNYLTSPNGMVDIQNNAPGCNNLFDIADSCNITSIPCLPNGNYHFTRQADIDRFPLFFEGCNELSGQTVLIGAWEEGQDCDINNLDGLSGVESIEGELYIRNTNLLSSLNGLNNLEWLGSNLVIGNNNSLQDLGGLYGISSISGAVTISDNTVLSSLSGLDNLTGIDHSLRIENNDNLLNLYGLVNLVSLDWLAIESNGALQDLSGLNSLTGPMYLGITSNTNLSSLLGLNNIDSIHLYLNNNDQLVNLSGLDNLTALSLELKSNDQLINLSGLENVVELGSLTIQSNDALVSISALENVTSIKGDLRVGNYWWSSWGGGGGNPSLHNLSGLHNVSTIEGSVTIRGNSSLTSIDDLSNLLSINGDLAIIGNQSLESLDGLENIDPGSIHRLMIHQNTMLSTCEVQSICNYLYNPQRTVSIYNNAAGCNSPGEIAQACGFSMPCLPYGDYYFYSQSDIDDFQSLYPECFNLSGSAFIGHPSSNWSYSDITNLEGLSAITSIEYDLSILGNDDLYNLSGLDNLSMIGNTLYMESNELLENLSELSNLGHVKYINIAYNDGLTSLDGLDNIDPEKIRGISINDHPLLSDCAVQSICEYLDIQSNAGFYNNAEGCNSIEEVDEACESVTIEEYTSFDEHLLYPNPSLDFVRIKYSLIEDSRISIQIFNLSGIQVLYVLENEEIKGEHELFIDLGGLPPGLYFCVMQTENRRYVEKIVKASSW